MENQINTQDDVQPKPWHLRKTEEISKQLNTSLTDGLTEQEARNRHSRYGPNTLTAEKTEPFWQEFFEELREPMQLMLLVTGMLYAIWDETGDAITIFAIILTLNTIEVVNEQRSKKAIASLHKLAEPSASVRRSGHFQSIPVEQVVPGDLILLQEGHRVPADARLVEAFNLSINESALTGESQLVEKYVDVLDKPDTPLAERNNMVYSSTLVSRGKGIGLVVATGMDTEIGRIAGMARQVKEPRTPLQLLMTELSKSLVWFALGFSVLIPLIGIFITHLPVKQMVLTGLSLAFATIPEEMPIIITMVLAIGAFRLSKQHAIAKRLNVVETLGSVTVIATDKTGTLTENQMAATRFEPETSKNHLLEIGVWCNDAVQNGAGFTGDPIDAALLYKAQECGIDVRAMRSAYPLINEFPFDNSRKRMSAVIQKDSQYWTMVKGAPESILAQSTQIDTGQGIVALTETNRQAILDRVAQMAGEGLRVLGFAGRVLVHDSIDQNTAESNLTFAGLVGFEDPPRPEVKEAIATCQRAGVRVMMITGDHPLTAAAIGRQVGLNSGAILTGDRLDKLSGAAFDQAVNQTTIFARATPEHKLRIVQSLQSQGQRVAVTGDGVNDAPALAAANIGVAMGESGTDVAREASALVLSDDNFATIVHAVEEGRLIYENLKKGVRYYLTCKLALVLITLLPALLSIPVPFAPVQIILMELFMDLMAAATFVMEASESDLLNQKPRDPQARFMDKAMITSIVTSSLGLFAAVSVLYLTTWYGTHNLIESQTTAFFAWLIGHVLLAFNMRSERQPILQIGFTSNRMMIIWAVTVALFLALISLVPVVQPLVKITPIPVNHWVLILVVTFLGTFWIEARKLLTYKKA